MIIAPCQSCRRLLGIRLKDPAHVVLGSFGSLRELAEFHFSSENRAACAETSVMRLEKENAALKLEIAKLKGCDDDFF